MSTNQNKCAISILEYLRDVKGPKCSRSVEHIVDKFSVRYYRGVVEETIDKLIEEGSVIHSSTNKIGSDKKNLSGWLTYQASS